MAGAAAQPAIYHSMHFCVMQRTIDIFKIDIECSEWIALRSILDKPEYLVKVKQLMIEFHACSPRRSKQRFLNYWRTLQKIDQCGFKRWRIWNNAACKMHSQIRDTPAFFGCFNVYYLNANYIL